MQTHPHSTQYKGESKDEYCNHTRVHPNTVSPFFKYYISPHTQDTTENTNIYIYIYIYILYISVYYIDYNNII